MCSPLMLHCVHAHHSGQAAGLSGDVPSCELVSGPQRLFPCSTKSRLEIGAELTPKTNKETPMTLWNVGGPHSPKNVVSHQGFLTVLPNRMLTMAALNTSLQKQLS